MGVNFWIYSGKDIFNLLWWYIMEIVDFRTFPFHLELFTKYGCEFFEINNNYEIFDVVTGLISEIYIFQTAFLVCTCIQLFAIHAF